MLDLKEVEAREKAGSEDPQALRRDWFIALDKASQKLNQAFALATSTIDLYTLPRTTMSLNNMINKIKDKATGQSQNENQSQAPTGGQEQDRGQEQKFNILPHPAVRRTTLASAYTDLSAIVISIPSESC